MKILFLGQSWQGSSARSIREALSISPGIQIDEVSEDHYFPKHKNRFLRAIHYFFNTLYREELKREVCDRLRELKPDVLVVYKGYAVGSDVILHARKLGVYTVNIFPDYSPHAYGELLKKSIGEYDLVISTKPFHVENWSNIYGYKNKCVFVPHGYDPKVHLWGEHEKNKLIDVVMVSSWRQQYEDMLVLLSKKIGTREISVTIGGPGWEKSRSRLPSHWLFPGAVHGRAYGELLRQAKIVIAPVHTDVVIDGRRQPGDEDTTRTYELAAANCFFLHRRTHYVKSIYSEISEVPMWDDANELADLILKYLKLDAERNCMSAAAHIRAVPAYSIESRAKEVLEHIKLALYERK